ncbi:hypothetical protein MTP99_011430 [Tenebrio molitor]|nr:hypothetical protein MTP99_011430 [Tenebrio molitor]
MGRASNGQALCSWTRRPSPPPARVRALRVERVPPTTGARPSEPARGFAASCRPGSCHTHNYILLRRGLVGMRSERPNSAPSTLFSKRYQFSDCQTVSGVVLST